MATPRFYCPSKLGPGAQLELPANAAHHAQRVLRLKAGDKVRLFNGDGHDYICELTRVTKDAVAARVTTQSLVENESTLDIMLAQSISAGDRMDFTLQKAVELGVARIQPLAAERSVVKLSGDRTEKRIQHWQHVVIAACEQSGRAHVPEVLPPLPLLHWLSALPNFTCKLLLDPRADQRLKDLPAPAGATCLLIGCEGGFTEAELIASHASGFRGIKLGPRVLRTETAALATLASMQTLWGDF